MIQVASSEPTEHNSKDSHVLPGRPGSSYLRVIVIFEHKLTGKQIKLSRCPILHQFTISLWFLNQVRNVQDAHAPKSLGALRQ